MREAENFDALIWRAPMMEHLRSPYLEDYNVDRDLQLRAIQDLTPYWHSDEMRPRYSGRLDAVFEYYFGTKFQMSKDRADAKKLFGQSAERTFKALADDRGTRADKPITSVGRRPKRDEK